jgi:hypothetical protein
MDASSLADSLVVFYHSFSFLTRKKKKFQQKKKMNVKIIVET